jgi:hypothetical protein
MNKTEIEQLSEEMKSVNLLLNDIENLIEKTYPINKRTDSNSRIITTVLMMVATNTIKLNYETNTLAAYDILLTIMLSTKDLIIAMFNAGLSDTKH